jgi:uncharacterized membrane protein
MDISNMLLLSYVILAVLYSVTWIQLAAVWATGHHGRPAILFVLSYGTVFMLSYSLSSMGTEYIMWGYIVGMTILFVSFVFISYRLFGGAKNKGGWRDAFSIVWQIVSKNSWGMLFQTFFTLSLFLDKIIVWISEGIRMGVGIQVASPYTTGSFLGFIPTISLIAWAYYSERLKISSKGMYDGTFKDIRNKTKEYKRLYRNGISTMMVMGVLILVAMIAIVTNYSGDPIIVTIAATVGSGVLIFQAIISNSTVLAAFNKNYVSALSMLMVCAGEGISIFFISNNIWYASLGFLLGSVAGLLISHTVTVRLISRFEYNAFRTFQTAP